MQTATDQIETPPQSQTLKTYWPWLAGLFGVAFILRLIYALQIPFPPLDDPAYYVQGARSLLNGHPFELEITWNYQPAPASVIHAGFDYWMPLTSVVLAASMGVLGDNPFATQLPGVLAGSLLPVLTVYLARRWQLPIWLGGLAGLFLALNPLLAFQSVTPDSQMIYAVLVVGAFLVWPVENESGWGRSFGLGMLIGLAYLTRSNGLFLGASWFVATLWQLLRTKNRSLILRQALLVIIGSGLIIGPWLLRTMLTFGFINSPTGLQTVYISNYATLFNYEAPINFQTFVNSGLNTIWQTRATAVQVVWSNVLSALFIPTFLLPLVGLVWLWRQRPAIGPVLLYGLALTVGLPLTFAVATSYGSFYHSVGSLAPAGALGYLYLIWQLAQVRGKIWRPRSTGSMVAILFGALLLLEIYQFVLTVPSTISDQQALQTTYTQINGWLQAHAPGEPVIADEPSTLNYATELPALRLPSGESLEVLQKLAQRYGVHYIVTTEPFGNYPALLDSPDNHLFGLAYRDPQGAFEIYETKS